MLARGDVSYRQESQRASRVPVQRRDFGTLGHSPITLLRRNHRCPIPFALTGIAFWALDQPLLPTFLVLYRKRSGGTALEQGANLEGGSVFDTAT